MSFMVCGWGYWMLGYRMREVKYFGMKYMNYIVRVEINCFLWRFRSSFNCLGYRIKRNLVFF